MESSYTYIPCPYCGIGVWGSDRDIDSGLRKHLDYCDAAPPGDDGE